MMNVDIPFIGLLKVMSHANASKYLPGGLWAQVSGFILVRENYGVERKILGMSMVTHMGLLLLTGFSAFVLSVPLWLEDDLDLKLMGISVVYIFMFTMLFRPKIIEKFFNIVLRKIGKQVIKIDFTSRELFLVATVLLFTWVFAGLSLALSIMSISDYHELVKLTIASTGIYGISWSIGFLTPIAPNGVGVREASLIFLLSQIVSIEVALIATILFRVEIIIRDIIIGLIGFRLKY